VGKRKIKDLSNINSVKNFKKNIEKTYQFFSGLEINIFTTKEVFRMFKARRHPKFKEYQNIVEFNKARLSYLYELGFIALFSNFEFFMYDLLRDLFKKYPNSFKKEKMVSYEEVSDFKNVREIKEYIVDSLAIEKAYDVKSWREFINRNFKITIFKTKKQFRLLLMLNALRNIFLHGGGVTNSKFRREMKELLKTQIPLKRKITLDRKTYFENLYRLLKGLTLERSN